MVRVAWLTDVHLNFLKAPDVSAFLEKIAGLDLDAVLVGGDIAEAGDLIDRLKLLGGGLRCPVYFVLGNHDFYHDSIRGVRSKVSAACGRSPRLIWLSESETIELTTTVGLVGHDGWADARCGDYEGSRVMLNDYLLIAELARIDRQKRRDVLESLGDEAASHIRRVLPAALEKYEHVVLLTHVPPWREACWHEGAISDDEWLPHFTCKALGDAVVEIMRDWPDRLLTVLCGHTHSSGKCCPAPNIVALTGGATYGAPEIQRVFEFD